MVPEPERFGYQNGASRALYECSYLLCPLCFFSLDSEEKQKNDISKQEHLMVLLFCDGSSSASLRKAEDQSTGLFLFEAKLLSLSNQC